MSLLSSPRRARAARSAYEFGDEIIDLPDRRLSPSAACDSLVQFLLLSARLSSACTFTKREEKRCELKQAVECGRQGRRRCQRITTSLTRSEWKQSC